MRRSQVHISSFDNRRNDSLDAQQHVAFQYNAYYLHIIPSQLPERCRIIPIRKMWAIHQPKPRVANSQTFHFLNDPPGDNHRNQHQLPTPSSSPDLRPPAKRLTIPDLVSTDEHFGKVNALQTAVDTLERASPPGDAVLMFNETGEGEYLLSARPWEVDECRKVNRELWDRLGGGHSPVRSPAPTCGPTGQPAALSYLTPPSSPEPARKYNLAPVAHVELPNVREPSIPSDCAGIFDHPAHPISIDESMEYISDCDDEFEHSDECTLESPYTLADGFSPCAPAPISSCHYYDGTDLFNSKRPIPPTAPMGSPSYDLPTRPRPTIKDLTSYLDLSKFPEWPIARGGFGEVWKGALVSDEKKTRPIAVKRLTMYTAAGDEGVKKITKRTNRELSIWSRLRHRNILPLLGTCSFRGGIGIVSGWQENGSAIEWVRTNPGVNRLELCKGICSGLKYLHDTEIVSLPPSPSDHKLNPKPKKVHGDLRGANVLISKSGTPRLIDFGLASVTGGNVFSASSTLAGTLRWMAPELQVTEQQGATAAGDMFAFGMTTLELFTGLPPFSDVNNDIAVLLKYQKGERPSRPCGTKRSNRNGNEDRGDSPYERREARDTVCERYAQMVHVEEEAKGDMI
ncbi:unnamed protein product [Rhizoctonia solani]|uniref:Protein kinase domain-containing protein n=1 Tax=Rhizoctonia solani TaxID=456999 RepID=A0A8H3GLA6_9AGAM|nr:unnamed protein product [Rhizoctonia solani]